ncbi:neuroendocrine convertase 2-like [Mytilus californianus]|uniref:neuroendocrine convertase 2-like n=1 Tax=Mytilus californianus TaxID=6549 RepID=UPI00224774DE|nr:neuroendocrine convertase 2-like [Mytilus californianus]
MHGRIRILGQYAIDDSMEAQGLSHNIANVDIYSNSWGPADGTGFEGPGTVTKAALQNGVINGRNGKGAIYVWSAGNGGTKDNCNGDGYVNSIYTVAVTSVQIGENAWYSEVCAPALAAAYGGSEEDRFLTTTTTSSGCKSEGIQGTSYAAPIVTGIVALTLEANPDLTWRDIQHLIVFTSTRNGLNDTYSDWSINGAKKEFSQLLGFGLIDADAMVSYGKIWETVPTQQTCTTSTSSPSVSTNTFLSDSITVTSGDCSSINYLEHVVADITFSYSGLRGMTHLYLISPSGTRSHLLHYRKQDAFDNVPAGSLTWDFMSVHFWNENPIGIWILELRSQEVSVTVTLDSWSLTFYGTTTDPWPETTTDAVTTTETTTDAVTTTETTTDAVTTETHTDAVTTETPTDAVTTETTTDAVTTTGTTDAVTTTETTTDAVTTTETPTDAVTTETTIDAVTTTETTTDAVTTTETTIDPVTTQFTSRATDTSTMNTTDSNGSDTEDDSSTTIIVVTITTIVASVAVVLVIIKCSGAGTCAVVHPSV